MGDFVNLTNASTSFSEKSKTRKEMSHIFGYFFSERV